jgi:Family of unknown function (DUF6338)
MDINFTAVLILIGFVVPGLSARRTRNLFCPKALDTVGATEELGQFVAAGLLIHLILISGYLLFFSQWCHAYAQDLREGLVSGGLQKVILDHYWFVICYLAVSVIAGYMLGVLSGLGAIRRWIGKLFSPLLRKMRISLLVDRPMVFDVFHREGFKGVTFIELEMKGGGGFYTGQLAECAIVSDEEPHKPVYLEKVSFRSIHEDEYRPLRADGVWFDLADASSVRIQRLSECDLRNGQVGSAAPSNQD